MERNAISGDIMEKRTTAGDMTGTGTPAFMTGIVVIAGVKPAADMPAIAADQAIACADRHTAGAEHFPFDHLGMIHAQKARARRAVSSGGLKVAISPSMTSKPV